MPLASRHLQPSSILPRGPGSLSTLGGGLGQKQQKQGYLLGDLGRPSAPLPYPQTVLDQPLRGTGIPKAGCRVTPAL